MTQPIKWSASGAAIMQFKQPRDPNTKADIGKLYDITPDQKTPCQVGGRECPNFACIAVDDGTGGAFNICSEHLPEVEAFAKLLAEMTPRQTKHLSKLVDEIKS